ncbi:MAG: class I SAM-dependent methyltransferase, partial [Bacteroidota bacterium]
FRKIDKHNIHFAQADLTTFSNPDSFDLIICVDVMEHIEDDNIVFKNFYTSLRTGGMLLVSTPSDLGGSDAHDHDDGSFIGEHVRNGYNKEAVQKQLTDAGFSSTEAYYTYGKPGHIAWVLSMKIPIKMLGISKLFFILLPFWYLITFPFFVFLNYLDTVIQHKGGTGLLVKAWK